MARNPLGGGHLRPSALSFVGDDRPDRRPPHSAPISHNCPPRDLRDFYHGLLNTLDDFQQGLYRVLASLRLAVVDLEVRLERHHTLVAVFQESL